MKTPRHYTVHSICLVAGLNLLAGITPALGTSAMSEAPISSHGLDVVRFANDRLTVKVQAASLEVLIEEIARQSGIAVILPASLKDRVSVRFRELPLEEGLRRLLRHHSFVLEYAPLTGHARGSNLLRPSTLWVLPGGASAHAMQRLPAEDSSADDARIDIGVWQAALNSDEPNDRLEAIVALEESEHPDAVPSLESALQDDHEDVQEAAIAALAEIGGDAAVHALAVALVDEIASIREQAVDALQQIGGHAAVEVLALALQDEDVSVREEVVAALAAIGGETAIRLLEQALADDEASIREAATNRLLQLRR